MDGGAPTRTATLSVPGAQLSYELRGMGPALLLMPGGPADAGVFGPIAPHLVPHYTVVTYDPRGLGHSPLEGPVDDDRIVEVLADDAHRLLAAVTTDKACVFANSGGAVIGLELAARHPEQIQTLVAHEPPKFVPPDAGRPAQPDFSDDLYETYRTQGVGPAMSKFMVGAGLG